MGAHDLLADLASAGLSIEAHDHRLVVRPASKLTDDLRARLRATKPELLALLLAPMPDRTCTECAHRLRRGTCAVPAVAGLEPPPGLRPGADWFGIRWAPTEHAQTCPGFGPKIATALQERNWKLANSEADRAGFADAAE